MSPSPTFVGLVARAANTTTAAASATSTHKTEPNHPPALKTVGILLALLSGVFIGTSFVIKKYGLLKSNAKYHQEAGEGYGYIKSGWWWTGMSLMAVGEICNFVAYAFTNAILVAPMGSLSVVVASVLSAIFLKERLSFVGKVGCATCVLGSIIIVLNAPQTAAVATIQDMQHLVIQPGFLTWTGVLIIASIFLAFWAGPRYGKTNMWVYISICSLIGGLSVSATQGIGAAIVSQIQGIPQFNQWFTYVLLVFVITTLVTEVIFLNKALNLFNTAIVTPAYFVYFTSSTIVTSSILYQGFKGTPQSITTVVLAFLCVCCGSILLNLSNSAKDVPDSVVFKGDLDQVRDIAEIEESEMEPRADSVRGTAAIVRAISSARRSREAQEATRVREDLKKDLEPIGENDPVRFEWDGIRRRASTAGYGNMSPGTIRRKTLHPPLGLSHFPERDEHDGQEMRETKEESSPSHSKHRLGGFFHHGRTGRSTPDLEGRHSQIQPMPLRDISVAAARSGRGDTPMNTPQISSQQHTFGLPDSLRRTSHVPNIHERAREIASGKSAATILEESTEPPPTMDTQRSFSFTRDDALLPASRDGADDHSPALRFTPRSTLSHGTARISLGQRGSSYGRAARQQATEEERLGLVKGDTRGSASEHSDNEHSDHSDHGEDDLAQGARYAVGEEKELEAYERARRGWGDRGRG